ncbi:LuxR family transcriptional regulator [Cryobacterium suzukii]|uniref:LuxR family transcriptional regulator n=1 Tax=Cryobacterium suzukii TaxID=1259198 RepID=A0A4R9ACK7_9MICO|nr:helix-turn-helix transcriptional regulator [Cryobacterium suzukii]TFD57275.1 LuxR family transcriptional regulator [Cryobacterium suzukii]
MDPSRYTRAVNKIARLSGQSTDLVSFWRESAAVLSGEIPHFWTPCWFTLDPASLLITSHFHEGLAEFPDAWLADEYYGEDLHRLADVASSKAGISTLHEATGGDPSGTRRWQQNMEMGGDQELIAGLRTRSGDVWGALGLYREPDRPMFNEPEKRFVKAITPYLAEGARRALMVGEATDPEGPHAPGLIVLNERWEIESTTPGVAEWLADFPGADKSAGQLPAAIQAVAGQAMHSFQDPDHPGEIAVSRVLSRRGTWMVLHGAPLLTGTERRVAVIVEPAHSALIYPLLMSAYGLTERERDVTRLVLEGQSTEQVADSLFVSANTVQQHLKSIFDKTGVRSRRDLVAKIFYTHYEPRFRDNEQRVDAGKPVRGGPLL